MAPLALPYCQGMPYWHHQLVLSCCPHQPESHQLSLQNLLQWRTDGHRLRPIDRTPGTPGSDKNSLDKDLAYHTPLPGRGWWSSSRQRCWSRPCKPSRSVLDSDEGWWSSCLASPCSPIEFLQAEKLSTLSDIFLTDVWNLHGVADVLDVAGGILVSVSDMIGRVIYLIWLW